MSAYAEVTSKGETTHLKKTRDARQVKAGDRLAFKLTLDGLVLMRETHRNTMDIAGYLLKSERKTRKIDRLPG